MSNFFFTSDQHFGHTNIIKYCNRPFSSVEEMDEKIIENWNKVVKPEDVVYTLGDFSLPDRKNYSTWESQILFVKYTLKRLNGKIIIVFGSHDKHAYECKHSFYTYHNKNTIAEVKINELIIQCSHCALLTWEKRTHGALSAFGHVHSGPSKKFPCVLGSYDVGVDNNDFTPISLEDFVVKARSKEGKLPFDIFDNYEGGN